EAALEELLLTWIANQNPAFMGYGELFDDSNLAETTDYERVVRTLRDSFHDRSVHDPTGEDLVEKLLQPARQAPNSLRDQLRWIMDTWTDVVGEDLRARLTLALDSIAEEDESARRAFERHAGGPGPGIDAAALHGFAGDTEYERFTPDREWMPNVV